MPTWAGLQARTTQPRGKGSRSKHGSWEGDSVRCLENPALTHRGRRQFGGSLGLGVQGGPGLLAAAIPMFTGTCVLKTKPKPRARPPERSLGAARTPREARHAAVQGDTCRTAPSGQVLRRASPLPRQEGRGLACASQHSREHSTGSQSKDTGRTRHLTPTRSPETGPRGRETRRRTVSDTGRGGGRGARNGQARSESGLWGPRAGPSLGDQDHSGLRAAGARRRRQRTECRPGPRRVAMACAPRCSLANLGTEG